MRNRRGEEDPLVIAEEMEPAEPKRTPPTEKKRRIAAVCGCVLAPLAVAALGLGIAKSAGGHDGKTLDSSDHIRTDTARAAASAAASAARSRAHASSASAAASMSSAEASLSSAAASLSSAEASASAAASASSAAASESSAAAESSSASASRTSSSAAPVPTPPPSPSRPAPAPDTNLVATINTAASDDPYWVQNGEAVVSNSGYSGGAVLGTFENGSRVTEVCQLNVAGVDMVVVKQDFDNNPSNYGEGYMLKAIALPPQVLRECGAGPPDNPAGD